MMDTIWVALVALAAMIFFVYLYKTLFHGPALAI